MSEGKVQMISNIVSQILSQVYSRFSKQQYQLLAQDPHSLSLQCLPHWIFPLLPTSPIFITLQLIPVSCQALPQVANQYQQFFYQFDALQSRQISLRHAHRSQRRFKSKEDPIYQLFKVLLPESPPQTLDRSYCPPQKQTLLPLDCQCKAQSTPQYRQRKPQRQHHRQRVRNARLQGIQESNCETFPGRQCPTTEGDSSSHCGQHFQQGSQYQPLAAQAEGTLAVSSKRSLMYLSIIQVFPTLWFPRKITFSFVLPDIVLTEWFIFFNLYIVRFPPTINSNNTMEQLLDESPIHSDREDAIDIFNELDDSEQEEGLFDSETFKGSFLQEMEKLCKPLKYQRRRHDIYSFDEDSEDENILDLIEEPEQVKEQRLDLNAVPQTYIIDFEADSSTECCCKCHIKDYNHSKKSKQLNFVKQIPQKQPKSDLQHKESCLALTQKKYLKEEPEKNWTSISLKQYKQRIKKKLQQKR